MPIHFITPLLLLKPYDSFVRSFFFIYRALFFLTLETSISKNILLNHIHWYHSWNSVRSITDWIKVGIFHVHCSCEWCPYYCPWDVSSRSLLMYCVGRKVGSFPLTLGSLFIWWRHGKQFYHPYTSFFSFMHIYMTSLLFGGLEVKSLPYRPPTTDRYICLRNSSKLKASTILGGDLRTRNVKLDV